MPETTGIRRTVRLSPGEGGGLTGLLRDLLASKKIGGVLLPLRLPSADGVALGLVTDPGELGPAELFAPVMPVQGARVVSSLTRSGATEPLVAVLKPCEWRAVVELVKFRQVDPEKLYVVVPDCAGTVEVTDLTRRAARGQGIDQTVDALWAAAEGGTPDADVSMRPACSLCDRFTAAADATLMRFGTGSGEAPVLEIGTGFAALLESAGIVLDEGTAPTGRQASIARLAAERARHGDLVLRELEERVKGPDKFLAAFSACIRCRNCMEVCPICYCPECLFRTKVLDLEPERYLRLAARKSALRLPADTLLFHVIRMAHMATSCVGCGVCESACPSRLPVSALFRMVGSDVQKLFDYEPGRDAAELPPPVTFKDHELEDAH